MRKVLLSGFVLAVFLPSMAAAQNVTYENYGQTNSLPTSGLALTAKSNTDGAFSLANFVGTLNKDASTKGKCNFTAAGALALKNGAAVLKAIAKAGSDSHDITYFDGSFTVNTATGSYVNGLATFNTAYTTTSSTANGGELNATNVASQALICSGPGGASGQGKCGNSNTCGGGANGGCSTQVGTPLVANGSMYARVWVFPFANDPDTANFPNAAGTCNTSGATTFAECCNDSSLAIIVHTHATFYNGTSNFSGTFTDQGAAGNVIGTKE